MQELGAALGAVLIFVTFIAWCFFCSGDPDVWDALDAYLQNKWRVE